MKGSSSPDPRRDEKHGSAPYRLRVALDSQRKRATPRRPQRPLRCMHTPRRSSAPAKAAGSDHKADLLRQICKAKQRGTRGVATRDRPGSAGAVRGDSRWEKKLVILIVAGGARHRWRRTTDGATVYAYVQCRFAPVRLLWFDSPAAAIRGSLDLPSPPYSGAKES